MKNIHSIYNHFIHVQKQKYIVINSSNFEVFYL